MDSVSVNQFRDNLKTLVNQAIDRHEPLKVTRRGGGDFIIIGAEDWEREQETLCVLQNAGLMRQIAESLQTHARASGYQPLPGEIGAILGV